MYYFINKIKTKKVKQNRLLKCLESFTFKGCQTRF